jgi:hypothetical protein
MNSKRWIFAGRTFPERLPIKVSVPIKTTAHFAAFGLSLELVVRIADSQILAYVSVIEGDMEVYTLKNLVETEIRVILDLAGYQSGGSFDMEIVSAIDRETDDCVVFGNIIPVLMNRRKADYGVFDLKLFETIMGNPFAKTVLADFREAMRMVVDTGFFCNRAIDSMMQSMKQNPKKKTTKEDWVRLHNALKITESYARRVKKHSDDARHGNLRNIFDNERGEVFEVTNEIIMRYFVYLVRGSKPLPEAEFPILN